MTHRRLLVFIFISITSSVKCELMMEKLIGGQPAPPEIHKYQVAIVGRHNKTTARYIACSAGILSNFFLMGNAECFFETNNEIMKLRFYAIFGSINLKYNTKDIQEILYIYTYTEYPLQQRHNIVMLQLAYSLNLDDNDSLKALKLPPKDIVYKTEARIAGYGFKSYQEKQYSVGRSRPKLSQKKDFLLTYAHATIVMSSRCQGPSRLLNTDQEICGVIPAYPFLKHRGLCKYDEGGPLVIGDDIVVGVANRCVADCNNTVYGHAYMKVTYYLEFINGVLLQQFIQGTVIRFNRHWIAPDSRKP